MRVPELVIIAADVSRVWPFLADPAEHAKWNPKVVSVKRTRSGPVCLGEQFEMVYRMSGKENPTRVEVIVFEAPHRIVFQHRIPWKQHDRVFREGYEIAKCPAGVRVTQTLDLTQSAIPWYFRAAIWFINHFGRAVEEPYMDRLKRAVENG